MFWKKKLLYIVLIPIAVLVIYFTYQHQSASAFKLKDSNIIYGTYSNGKYSLSLANPSSLKSEKSKQMTTGWTDRIYTDYKNKVYIPLNYKPDMTVPEDKVIIYDLSRNKQSTVKVGVKPHFVFFKNGNAYVLCEEDGTTPSVYKIDKNNQSKKLFMIPDGGLISNAVFDGNDIYFNSLKLTADSQYPKLTKVSLKGKITTRAISKENLGINNLLLFNHKLIMGLQAPANQSTLAMFDPQTLEKVDNLNYTEMMVGDIVPMSNKLIAVTNYSEVAQKGNKISIIDVDENKLINTFTSKNLTEKLAYIKNRFVSVDNLNNKLELLDKDGKSIKVMNIPTQVSNLILYDK
ncbi:hypothetical protein RCG23_13670 [Neobacillus sp. PS3-34]|uniref:hypothetical protein n=1 Tax=Neobacillus sp. PS3-34 TaxID=3070678 RepID=UPI0027DFA97A|nr:hypothetical protein [Neobacillus sp. PS3-34]WML46696.1 hypothetical protein RCG23_13670 [Neobacillus sp. PS3-34]